MEFELNKHGAKKWKIVANDFYGLSSEVTVIGYSGDYHNRVVVNKNITIELPPLSDSPDYVPTIEEIQSRSQVIKSLVMQDPYFTD